MKRDDRNHKLFSDQGIPAKMTANGTQTHAAPTRYPGIEDMAFLKHRMALDHSAIAALC